MISLLEFRNYLFCRQAALLFAMGRAWEVAERAFDFVRNTVNEMKALEVIVSVDTFCFGLFRGSLTDFVWNTVNEMKVLEVIVAVVTFCLECLEGLDFVHNTVNEMKALAVNVLVVTFLFGVV